MGANLAGWKSLRSAPIFGAAGGSGRPARIGSFDIRIAIFQRCVRNGLIPSGFDSNVEALLKIRFRTHESRFFSMK